jgi:hypothetical protein
MFGQHWYKMGFDFCVFSLKNKSFDGFEFSSKINVSQDTEIMAYGYQKVWFASSQIIEEL